MKLEFHIHTKYSKDSLLKLETIRKIMERNDIIPVITDHDEIKGALKYRELYRNCIVGQEITSSEGEIIGIFLKEKIRKGLSPEATVNEIRKQGGIVCVPHPFDGIRTKALKHFNLEIIKPDIIETFNRRSLNGSGDAKAQEYAISNNLLQIAGSDAHAGIELARTYNILPDFNISSPKDFLKSMKKVEHITSKRTSFWVHLYGKVIYVLKKLEIL
jgi:predicted metal-dependent phosphoesterase TrpH